MAMADGFLTKMDEYQRSMDRKFDELEELLREIVAKRGIAITERGSKRRILEDGPVSISEEWGKNNDRKLEQPAAPENLSTVSWNSLEETGGQICSLENKFSEEGLRKTDYQVMKAVDAIGEINLGVDAIGAINFRLDAQKAQFDEILAEQRASGFNQDQPISVDVESLDLISPSQNHQAPEVAAPSLMMEFQRHSERGSSFTSGNRDLCEALWVRFGDHQSVKLVEDFNTLKQDNDVKAYTEKFEELKASMLAFNPSLSETYFMTSYISGLKQEIKNLVKLKRPKTLAAVYEEARMHYDAIQAIISDLEQKYSDRSNSMENIEDWGAATDRDADFGFQVSAINQFRGDSEEVELNCFGNNQSQSMEEEICSSEGGLMNQSYSPKFGAKVLVQENFEQEIDVWSKGLFGVSEALNLEKEEDNMEVNSNPLEAVASNAVPEKVEAFDELIGSLEVRFGELKANSFEFLATPHAHESFDEMSKRSFNGSDYSVLSNVQLQMGNWVFDPGSVEFLNCKYYGYFDGLQGHFEICYAVIFDGISQETDVSAPSSVDLNASENDCFEASLKGSRNWIDYVGTSNCMITNGETNLMPFDRGKPVCVLVSAEVPGAKKRPQWDLGGNCWFWRNSISKPLPFLRKEISAYECFKEQVSFKVLVFDPGGKIQLEVTCLMIKCRQHIQGMRMMVLSLGIPEFSCLNEDQRIDWIELSGYGNLKMFSCTKLQLASVFQMQIVADFCFGWLMGDVIVETSC